MKSHTKSLPILIIAINFAIATSVAQDTRDLQNFRTPGFNGLNQFENLKDSTENKFTGVKVRLGGDLAMQFQAISHSTSASDTLAAMGSNFTLPTANLNLDVQLADGVRMSMVTYLSSRHHPEAWVKGGYLQLDKLDFIKEDFLKGFMRIASIRVGLDEINYGDAHFRRSDNARAIYNPFVGNFIMDAFNTEAFGEVNIQSGAFIMVAGLSNGKLNQSPLKGDNEYKASPYGKIGYDNQINDDFRLRATGSFYASPGYDNGQYLYSGDRTGSRYYNVLQAHNASSNFRSGRFNPGFWKYTAAQFNTFVKWQGLEFFGIYERVQGDQNETATDGVYTQVGLEMLYRFGESERVAIGGRYNFIRGNDTLNSDERTINRLNIGLGWFITNNIVFKMEYVNQSYLGDAWLGTIYEEGNFNGLVLEAAISF